MSTRAPPLILTPLGDIPEVRSGDDLAALLSAALSAASVTLAARDLLVVAQKIVSKAEGRSVSLAGVTPGERALALAQVTGKDARLIELILGESQDVVRAKRDVLIVRHRLGYVMANAGIDRSNLSPGGPDQVLLLPRDPDASAAALRAALGRSHPAPGVIISDSFGRAWRRGVVNVALGAAGIPSLLDRRGERDRAGRPLQVTEVAIADALAAAAGLLMGEAGEGVPAVHVRGCRFGAPARAARELLRPLGEDLFR